MDIFTAWPTLIKHFGGTRGKMRAADVYTFLCTLLLCYPGRQIVLSCYQSDDIECKINVLFSYPNTVELCHSNTLVNNVCSTWVYDKKGTLAAEKIDPF